MTNTIEKISNRSSSEFPEDLHLKVDNEFREFATTMYKGIRKGFKELKQSGLNTDEEAEKVVAERKKMYNSLDFNGRISHLTNNFYMWWPGGYYREILEEEKEKSPNAKRIIADEKLISDLDSIISNEGYSDILNLIQKKDTECSDIGKRMSAIANVFLKMRSMGYDGSRLRR